MLAASLPAGDVPSVCQPQTVLPDQLALFSDYLSVPPEVQGPQNLQNGARLTPQTVMVSFLSSCFVSHKLVPSTALYIYFDCYNVTFWSIFPVLQGLHGED